MGGLAGVSNADKFSESALGPAKSVRVAAFDRENADPAVDPGMKKAL